MLLGPDREWERLEARELPSFLDILCSPRARSQAALPIGQGNGSGSSSSSSQLSCKLVAALAKGPQKEIGPRSVPALSSLQSHLAFHKERNILSMFNTGFFF